MVHVKMITSNFHFGYPGLSTSARRLVLFQQHLLKLRELLCCFQQKHWEFSGIEQKPTKQKTIFFFWGGVQSLRSPQSGTSPAKVGPFSHGNQQGQCADKKKAMAPRWHSSSQNHGKEKIRIYKQDQRGLKETAKSAKTDGSTRGLGVSHNESIPAC